MSNKLSLLFLFFSFTIGLNAQEIPTYNPDDIDIPYEKFVLDNGLTLIVHEDHKAPIVAVNVWYHVGSKNEKPGKSGFAHLFEHLMFNGSEHFNDDYFQALESIGGTDLNGTTNNDRTNYFQNVPVAALDQVLWLESDRMGHLLGAIDQAKLDEQRGVVQNEKRQGENNPYGRQYDLITKAMYPPGHPYSWTVIGELEHLNAASVEDVHEWFKTYYGAANAVLSIAGDVNAKEIHEKVKLYFGNIDAGPTLIRPEVNIPVRTANTRQSYQDRVPEDRIVQVWNTAQAGSKEDIYFDLISDILSSGKNSRLYKKLVYEDQTASSAYAFQWTKEISSNFIIQANVKPGVELETVENTINEVVTDFIKNGPSETELKKVKARYFANFIKGLERIGGFGGKSDILASNQVYKGSPDAYKERMKIIAAATTADLKRTAAKYMSQGKHTLICNPFPEFTTTGKDADRTMIPEIGKAAKVKFPELQKTTLKNGLNVILAQRSGSPTIVMDMVFDAGYATDFYSKAGTASLAMNMMDEGTQKLNALQLNDQMQVLGASVYAGSDLDASYVYMSTLKPSLDASLDIYADIIQNPSFPQKEFDRLKKEQVAKINREKTTPFQMAFRVMPQYLYGKDHPYSLPMTGSGFEKTIETMTLDETKKFYADWIKPNNATLIVVGDIGMDELTKKLENKFSAWKKGKTPEKKINTVAEQKGNVLYLLDRPESQQSVIIAGHLIAPYGDLSEIAREATMNIFAGEFTSRLNMNLREDKHWAYGARGLAREAKGQRPMIAYAPVQTDKTKESIQEIIKEFNWITTSKPITQEEFDKTTKNTILKLPGRWETNNSVNNSLNTMVKFDLKEDYFQGYDDLVRNLKLEDVRKNTKEIFQPESLKWFVVGDKSKILEGLKELKFDKIIIVDADGNPIETIDKGSAKP